MKSINLFAFTRIPIAYATEYLNMLSAREQKAEVKVHEFDTLKCLVEDLLAAGVSAELFEGFFYSYNIQHIGKEFDLLKILPGKMVLNIELKSEPIEDEGIEKQLRQNRYYLGPLGEEIYSFSYVALTGELFCLKDGSCDVVEMTELVKVLDRFNDYMTDGIEKLFEPKKFLISPINTPDLFLEGKYFLTQQQQMIKEEIITQMQMCSLAPCFIGITGSAGTGKTLLLYDLVKEIAEEGEKCCIIHSDIMYEGHKYLNERWDHVDIYPAKKLKNAEVDWLSKYGYIFVDEAHRISKSAVDKILGAIRACEGTAIFSYDFDQWLSHSEKERDIPGYLRKLEDYSEKVLSKRIRTSAEIASFYRSMLNLKNLARGEMDYSDIDVLYAGNKKEADALIRLYTRQLGYSHTRHVVGQEFDKVLIVLDSHFHYDQEGRIREEAHVKDGVSSYQLLYHDVSRVREKLCVLVVKNYPLFLKIADIKYSMLEKCQYKPRAFDSGFSAKQLNKLAKAVKDGADLLTDYAKDTAADNVDIIIDEIFSQEMSRKIIFNSIRFLRFLAKNEPEAFIYSQRVEAFASYIDEVLAKS